MSKNYNERKIEILRLANKRKDKKLTPFTLAMRLDIEFENARKLLNLYFKQKLFSHPKRGIYRLRKNGEARLRYLELRKDISIVTGVNILNHHLDKKHLTPMSEILHKYITIKGEPLPDWFTY